MSQVVDWRVSVGLVGVVCRYLSAPLLGPVGVALVYGEDPLPFLVTILVALMWIGRLEILSVLAILSPSYWRR